MFLSVEFIVFTCGNYSVEFIVLPVVIMLWCTLFLPVVIMLWCLLFYLQWWWCLRQEGVGSPGSPSV